MRRMFSLEQLKGIADSRVQAVASSGNLENVKIFEEIVDKDGHKRFVEGNGTQESISGMTLVYNKWALSGNHLMLVLAGSFADEAVITNAQTLVQFNLPAWVQNKIYGVWGSNIELKTINMFADNWTSQDLDVLLVKQEGGVRLQAAANRTMTATRNFRFAFDLIIDNE